MCASNVTSRYFGIGIREKILCSLIPLNGWDFTKPTENY